MIQPVCDVTCVAAASNHPPGAPMARQWTMLQGQTRDFPCTRSRSRPCPAQRCSPRCWYCLHGWPPKAHPRQCRRHRPPKAGDFRGFSGVHWPTDFEVRSGHCDRARITRNPAAQRCDGEPRPAPRAEPQRGHARRRACVGSAAGTHLALKSMRATGPAWARCWSWAPVAAGCNGTMAPPAFITKCGRMPAGMALPVPAAPSASRRPATTSTSSARRMACEAGPGLWQLSGL